MAKLSKYLLRITFLIDFLITFGFGLFSWFSPKGTFGTLIAISQPNESLILSLLNGLSIFYILLGLTCLVGFITKYPTNILLSAIMILRHGWIGTQGILGLDNKKEWLIGNPNPDIIIHLAFVSLYILGILFLVQSKKVVLS